MKIKNLLLLFLAITITSCVFTEEIRLKNDGSGSYAFKMDLSKMMEAMGEMGQKSDSIKKAPEKKDTIIFFKDILEEMKDSIATMSKEEQEVMKSLEDLKVRIHTDEEKKQMNMDFLFDFKSIADLKNMNEKVQRAQALSDKKKKNNGMKDAFNEITDVEYSFNENVFKRTVKYKEGITKEKIEEQRQMLAQGGEMLQQSTYRIVYYFEDKVKSVSLKEAKIGKDGKSVRIEMPMDTVMKNPLLLNFEVKLK